MNSKHLINYLRLALALDLKRNLAYPGAFWFGMAVLPLWSIVQIFFIEILFSQTDSFLGYNKYAMYILTGTYRLIVNLAYFIFLKRLYELKNLIRGTGQETFDMVLLKPIDSQLYGTFGRFSFIEMSQLAVGLSLVIYGYLHDPFPITLLNVLGYLILSGCGVLFLYMLYLFLRTCIFWVQEFDVSEGLYETYRGFGKYPSAMYTGSLGILLNIVLPITLTGALPVEYLYGKAPLYIVFTYLGITSLLFYLSRLFWLYSIKKYTSFSS